MTEGYRRGLPWGVLVLSLWGLGGPWGAPQAVGETARAIRTSAAPRMPEAWQEFPNPSVFDRGPVRLAVVTPTAYLEALERHPDLQMVAAERPPGLGPSATYLVSRKDGSFRGPQDLHGSRVALSDPTRHDPVPSLAFLLEQGVDLTSDMSFVTPMTPWQELATGRVDLWATDASGLASLTGAQRRAVDIVAVTGRGPSAVWVAGPEVPPTTVQSWRQALVQAAPDTVRPGVRGFVPPESIATELTRLKRRWEKWRTRLKPLLKAPAIGSARSG